jgi:hypothetical protein
VNLASEIGRRLAAARTRRPPLRVAPPPPGDQRPADDARLDSLRGELVRELDRLAAADEACSAAFRRVA